MKETTFIRHQQIGYIGANQRFIHHHPRALFYEIPGVGTRFSDIPEAERSTTVNLVLLGKNFLAYTTLRKKHQHNDN